jgi:amino acid adenylation domain-containing protein
MEEFINKVLQQNVLLKLEEGDLKVFVKDKAAISKELIQEIKEKKEALVVYLKRLELNELDEKKNNKIPTVAQSQNYDLSSAQTRLWVLNQFGGNAAYNMPFQLPLLGTYNLENLERAIRAVIERHEILRTVFKEDETGEVKQWICSAEELDFKLKYLDYRALEEKEENVQQYIREDRYQPFDLKEGPLLRAAIFQLGEEEYVFYYNLHHIIGDAWSMNILSKDVLAFYEAFQSGQAASLSPLNLQYKDYAAWEKEQVKSPVFTRHKEFWLKQLDGKRGLIDLPGNKQRPLIKSANGYTLGAFINSEDTKKLKAFSQQHGGSLFIGLLTSWNILFQRYTQERNLVIGTAVAGREHADLEDQIGFYINTLALKNYIDPEKSFSELFGEVKKNTLLAYSHQAYPFDHLVEDLKLNRNTSRNVVFDVMFTLHNVAENEQGLMFSEEQQEQVIDFGTNLAKFDLTLRFIEKGSTLFFEVNYNTDVYEREVIEQLIFNYKRLLSQVLQQADLPVYEHKYLSEEELQQQLVAFNDTEVTYPKESTAIQLFEEQVRKTPEKIALVAGEQKWSFRNLNEEANRLAGYIRGKQEIKADELIGICLERNEWVIIAMLAVLKAGGAYVPIDPVYPAERVDYLLQNSRCKMLIDEQVIKDFKQEREIYEENNLPLSSGSQNLVYVIYTSGSTGKPKGAMIEHRGLLNHINWFNRDFKVTDKDKTVLITSYAFDGSVTSIWSCLLSGAELHILSKEQAQNPEGSLRYIGEKEISFLKLVPSLFSSMLNTSTFEETNCFKNIRFVKLGGENIVLKDLQKCFKKYPNIHFANHYGATEASIGSVIHHISRENFEEFASCPVVGAPFDNFRIYILDEHMQLLPIGATGDIYIAGDGVGRGYIGLEELNKERFLKGFFKEKVMYKTGDKGAWTTQGTILFKGRNDNQVKVRGYRIELGEIENVLLRHESISEAVVRYIGRQEDDKALLAYIRGEQKLSSSEIRTFLSTELPDYMIPAQFIQVETIPLTANGKVDTARLPQPGSALMETGKEFIAPRNKVERELAEIWQELLGREEVGVSENFFELGGHSLKVISLINAIGKKMEIKLAVEDFFLDPTIEACAKEIERVNWLKTKTVQTEKANTIEI